MAKEYFFFKSDDLLVLQGSINLSNQGDSYYKRTDGWYLTPEDAIFGGT